MNEAHLTLSDLNRKEPSVLSYDDKQDLLDFVNAWISTKDKNVFVCFNENKYLNTIESFLVSDNTKDIINFTGYTLDLLNTKDVEFCIFEFKTFKEAFDFGYLIKGNNV